MHFCLYEQHVLEREPSEVVGAALLNQLVPDSAHAMYCQTEQVPGSIEYLHLVGIVPGL